MRSDSIGRLILSAGLSEVRFFFYMFGAPFFQVSGKCGANQCESDFDALKHLADSA